MWFPYLMITTKDEFPGVYVTREPRQDAKLYGPFTSVYQLKEAVTLLQKAFKFRTCHLEISDQDDKRRFFRPCLLYPIKQCTAPCAAREHSPAAGGAGWAMIDRGPSGPRASAGVQRDIALSTSANEEPSER